MIKNSKQESRLKVAKAMKQNSKEKVTDDIDFLAESLDTDIRENLPPQLHAVVGAVLSAIKEL